MYARMYVCMLVTPLCVLLCAVFPCFVFPILVLYLPVSTSAIHTRISIYYVLYLHTVHCIYSTQARCIYTHYTLHTHLQYLHWSVSVLLSLYWPVLVSSRPFGPFCPFFLLPSSFRPHRPSQLDALRRYSTPTTLHTHLAKSLNTPTTHAHPSTPMPAHAHTHTT